MKTTNKNSKQIKNDEIKNPIKTTIGKAVIWILLGAMVLSPIIGLIFLLVS